MSNFIKDDELKGKIVSLADVQTDGLFDNRLSSGSELIDQMFGGIEMPGLMRGSTTLFTGGPGSGKSTMMLQLAELFALAGQRVIVNIGEESSKMVKYRAERLKLQCGFELSAISDADELHSRMCLEAPDILIQDSLQSLRIDEQGGHKTLVGAVERLVDISKRAQTAVMAIGHVTKSGQFAGPKTVQHDVDAHVHLNVGMDGGRTMQMEKNRFGPSHIAVALFMSADGMELTPAQPRTLDSTNVPRAQRSREREAAAIEAIQQLLLLGERLNAYSLADYPQLQGTITSDAYMRHYLRLTVQQMLGQGFNVVSAPIHRRETFWLEA